jgi:hypothetical protein
MCIDYTSLNKACSKYEYPLPCICQIVDSMASCELLSFLNAYSGYHQISLAIDDKEKIAFITLFGIFCYTKMMFGLKNRRATYQKGIHIILETQIGRNVEVYIDDVVVKSKKCGDHQYTLPAGATLTRQPKASWLFLCRCCYRLSPDQGSDSYRRQRRCRWRRLGSKTSQQKMMQL